MKHDIKITKINNRRCIISINEVTYSSMSDMFLYNNISRAVCSNYTKKYNISWEEAIDLALIRRDERIKKHLEKSHSNLTEKWNKYKFIYHCKEFKSFPDCCNAYSIIYKFDLDPTNVRYYAKKHNLSLQDALDKILEKKGFGGQND